MKRSVQSAVARLLALVMFVGSTLIAPGTVLCLGPGNHCHLEVTAGAECNSFVPGSEVPASGPRDGCPTGSKDFRISVDSHRTDTMGVIALATMPVLIAWCPVEISPLWRLSPTRFSIARELNSAPVLRC
jgi:hypothetical protein